MFSANALVDKPAELSGGTSQIMTLLGKPREEEKKPVVAELKVRKLVRRPRVIPVSQLNQNGLLRIEHGQEMKTIVAKHKADKHVSQGFLSAEELDVELKKENKNFAAKYNLIFKDESITYLYGKELGEGSFGIVSPALDDNGWCAVKCVAYTPGDEEALREIQTATTILKKLNAFKNQVLLNDKSYTVMTWYPSIDLARYFDGNPVIPTLQRLRIMQSMCNDIENLHTNYIVHRDIKPYNFICDQYASAKIIDFESAKLMSPHQATLKNDTVGTPYWMDWSYIRAGYYNPYLADIFGLGVTLTTLLEFGNDHYFNLHPVRVPFTLISPICALAKVDEKIIPEEVTRTSVHTHVGSMISKDLGDRPSMSKTGDFVKKQIAAARNTHQVKAIVDYDELLSLTGSPETDDKLKLLREEFIQSLRLSPTVLLIEARSYTPLDDAKLEDFFIDNEINSTFEVHFSPGADISAILESLPAFDAKSEQACTSSYVFISAKMQDKRFYADNYIIVQHPRDVFAMVSHEIITKEESSATVRYAQAFLRERISVWESEGLKRQVYQAPVSSVRASNLFSPTVSASVVLLDRERGSSRSVVRTSI